MESCPIQVFCFFFGGGGKGRLDVRCTTTTHSTGLVNHQVSKRDLIVAQG